MNSDLIPIRAETTSSNSKTFFVLGSYKAASDSLPLFSVLMVLPPCSKGVVNSVRASITSVDLSILIVLVLYWS